jgi:hypothetical protein
MSSVAMNEMVSQQMLTEVVRKSADSIGLGV